MIDSGACEHVCPPSFAPSAPVNETVASRAGKCYSSADGGKLRNMGVKNVTAISALGQKTQIKLQVAENLTKTLFSVSKLEQSGNSVIFHSTGSYIHNHSTGSTTPLRKENGAYIMDLWIEEPSDPAQQCTGRIVSVEPAQAEHPDQAHHEQYSGFPRLPWE